MFCAKSWTVLLRFMYWCVGQKYTPQLWLPIQLFTYLPFVLAFVFSLTQLPGIRDLHNHSCFIKKSNSFSNARWQAHSTMSLHYRVGRWPDISTRYYKNKHGNRSWPQLGNTAHRAFFDSGIERNALWVCFKMYNTSPTYSDIFIQFHSYITSYFLFVNL